MVNKIVQLFAIYFFLQKNENIPVKSIIELCQCINNTYAKIIFKKK